MMEPDIQQKFFEVFNRDKARYIKKWLVSWDYQVKRKKRKISYGSEQPEDFDRYNGPDDLIKWMNWFPKDYANYLPESLINPLIEESLKHDREILLRLGIKHDFPNYSKRIGLNNAHDAAFPNLYPVPERNRIRNVIDFGAGYGRQANLWSQSNENIYVALDAIPKSYAIQHLYFSSLGRPFYDYASNPDGFRISNDKKGIYHLPTWRYDLLPDNFFDMVMAVQVLRELNSTLVRKIIQEFHRVLKPGGMFYIRDHGDVWKPAGKMNIDKYLIASGFTLEFKPHIILDSDLHGIPRIWRKNDPRVINSQKPDLKGKLRTLAEDLDAISGGRLRKTFGKGNKREPN